ncbi:hypothetical protein PAPYR_3306 [Paratrimastix pyriformis]|uniref:Uncharacterized protein n=1 Tax=Paratrimastix pyriformis TaxID=342808 RepID=A0ABQ8UM93_9EUKA|nr:hypothetical protein PAPYR_3306 [Paratrimastix pyriformis]
MDPGYLLQAGRGSDTFYTPSGTILGTSPSPRVPYWAQLVAAQTPVPRMAPPRRITTANSRRPVRRRPAQQSLAPRYWEGSGGSLGTSWAGSCGPVPRSGWVGANSAALMPRVAARRGDEDREAEAGGLLDGGLPQAAGGRDGRECRSGRGRRVELPIHPVPGAHLGDLIRSVTALPALGLIVTGWQDGTIRYSHCPR